MDREELARMLHGLAMGFAGGIFAMVLYSAFPNGFGFWEDNRLLSMYNTLVVDICV